MVPCKGARPLLYGRGMFCLAMGSIGRVAWSARVAVIDADRGGSYTVGQGKYPENTIDYLQAPDMPGS